MTTIYEGKQWFRDRQFPFHIDRYTIARSERILPHSHDFIELVFVVNGGAVHEMPGSRHQLQAGDVFVIEPKVAHSYEGTPDREAVVYNVLFDPGFLRKELETLQQIPSFIQFFYLMPFLRRNASFIPYQLLTPEQKLTIEGHLDLLRDEYFTCRDGWQLLVKTRLIECLVWLSRYLQDGRHHLPETLGDREWMDSVKHFVERNHSRSLSLPQISRISGMSVSSFTSKFKEATGRSLLEYKHEVQIARACSLLADTDRKILDIAHETGFNDISFFNKIFRKHRNMTPRAYRQTRR